MQFKKEELIKSPLNYTGGKYKLLPQILPLFPDNIDTFVDLFCGGGDVGINVNADTIICNDINQVVIELLQYINTNSYNKIVDEIEHIITRYGLSDSSKYGYEYYDCNSNDGLSKYNKSKYLNLRNDYNDGNRTPMMFYTMLIYAFNNYIKFNKENNFTTAVNKRDFNNNLKLKLEKCINNINNKNIKFETKDFKQFNMEKLNKNSFVYADPPYLITSANYNSDWRQQDDLDLMKLLDILNSKHIKFAMSNVLEHKGRINDILKEWSSKYNVHYLDYDYKNCNYQGKNTEEKTIEVLITNY